MEPIIIKDSMFEKGVVIQGTEEEFKQCVQDIRRSLQGIVHQTKEEFAFKGIDVFTFDIYNKCLLQKHKEKRITVFYHTESEGGIDTYYFSFKKEKS